MEYKNIKTPKELYEFMSKNITYGYLGKNNKIYHFGDKNFNDDWTSEYILETYDDVLNTKVGNCWDQVELEREWFSKHNYEFKTYYHQVILDYQNPYPTHTFLVYKENDKYYWFENAWDDMKGIHEFNTLEELLDFEYKENLKLLIQYNIKNNEIDKISYFEYDKPKNNISSEEFVNYVVSCTKIR